MEVDRRSPETAYATKPNIVVPSYAFPTQAHVNALEARAAARQRDDEGNAVITATNGKQHTKAARVRRSND